MRCQERLELGKAELGLLVDNEMLKRFWGCCEISRFYSSEQLVMNVIEMTPRAGCREEDGGCNIGDGEAGRCRLASVEPWKLGRDSSWWVALKIM